jgi:hypothetical protein
LRAGEYGMRSQQTCFSERERTRAIPEADDLPCLPDLPVVEMALILARVIGSDKCCNSAMAVIHTCKTLFSNLDVS